MRAAQKKIMERIREATRNGPISYRDYIEIALYTPGAGYYARPGSRIGRHHDRDFYTAESLGPVFARLVAAAARDLLGSATAARSEFVEIAAEPGGALLDHLDGSLPFAGSRTIRLGDPAQARGPVAILANEWLDALPFHRIAFEEDVWRERGITLYPRGHIREDYLAEPTPAVASVLHRLPETAPPGYKIDLPLDAEAALAGLLQSNWTGLLLLFDYGATWASITSERPEGTARTYHRHKTGSDLLDQPGEKDITCTLCWDPLMELLHQHNFHTVHLESQESFLVQRAAAEAEAIIRHTGGSFSKERQTLMELIHPAHMGHRFQVLWAIR